MIIKSSSRSGAASLARHLTNTHDNEKVRVTSSRGFLVNSVHEALDDMQDFAIPSRCRKHLLHVSINPPTTLSESEWALAWRSYEREFNLTEHPFIEVEHQKHDRHHRHRVYTRIRDDGTAVPLAHTYPRQEKITRKLEYAFGYPLTPGRHNKTVMHWLEAEGAFAIAAWMRDQQATTLPRPASGLTRRERQQEQRTKYPIKRVESDLQAAWAEAGDGTTFLRLIVLQGYILAKGDRRDVVVVDRTGNIHSPRRRLRVKALAIREFLAELIPTLPTLDQVRDVLAGLPVAAPAQQPAENLQPQQHYWLQQYREFFSRRDR
jgi:hypothetical protein